MIHRMLALPLLILMGSFVMAEDMPQTLFDFTVADTAKDWQTVKEFFRTRVGHLLVPPVRALEIHSRVVDVADGASATKRARRSPRGRSGPAPA